ncbi:MAG: hypothetical protein CMK71_11210 [Pseudomonadaceae bacterium]|nr:hypothetical protein [Pseudomonadaceae bacterium]
MLWAAVLALHRLLASPTGCLRAADAAMTTLVVGVMLTAAPARRAAGACVVLALALIVVGVALERVILPRVHAARRSRRGDDN